MPPPEASAPDPALTPKIVDPILRVESLSLWYSGKQALDSISLAIPQRQITAFIGPSGCGKSTLLRCINRLNDLVDEVRIQGDILLEGSSVYDPRTDVNALRKRVGMVFQKSNPFPKSIYENVAYGCRIHGMKRKRELDEVVERSLRNAALWDEVRDRLEDSALGLSGGQQQRLCIARAIAVEPEVVLLDEPCSALDPIATAKIEELMQDLKNRYTLVIVTHNMQQASRVSDYTAFLYLGRLIEYEETERLFLNPAKKQTEDYITGRFGIEEVMEKAQRHFEGKLDDLSELLLRLGGLVEESIGRSVRALVDRDSKMARQVIQDDTDIDRLELEIDQLSLELLALQQPLARDLRFITTALKINVDLERMADLAVNVSERAIEINDQPQLKPFVDIPLMARRAQEMVHGALDAFVRRDSDRARAVIAMDDELDRRMEEIFRELLSFMLKDPNSIPRALRLTSVAKYFERIGDHATNVCEQVVFMTEGRVIRHSWLSEQPRDGGPA